MSLSFADAKIQDFFEINKKKTKIMRKLLIILLSILSLTAFAQGGKTVAVLDPICRDNSVNAFFQQMVRGAMESAVTLSLRKKWKRFFLQLMSLPALSGQSH